MKQNVSNISNKSVQFITNLKLQTQACISTKTIFQYTLRSYMQSFDRFFEFVQGLKGAFPSFHYISINILLNISLTFHRFQLIVILLYIRISNQREYYKNNYKKYMQEDQMRVQGVNINIPRLEEGQTDHFKQWSMKNQITFEQPYPNIGWTNAVLFKPFQDKPKQLMLYLPSYLVMKIKNFKNFQIQEQTSQANVVLILQVYYGDLPKFLIDLFKDKLQIQFSLNEKILCGEKENGIIKKINQKTRMITFTIRTSVTFEIQPRQIIFCTPPQKQKIDEIYQYQKPSKSLQGFSNSLWLSPFQLLNQNLFITFHKVDIKISQLSPGQKLEFINLLKKLKLHQNDKYRALKNLQELELEHLYDNLQSIKLMINMMNSEDQHFKINMNSPNQSMLGYYSLAENLLSTKYLHTKVQDLKINHNYYLEMLILKKTRLKFDINSQKKQLQKKIERINKINSNYLSSVQKARREAYEQKLKTVEKKNENVDSLILGMNQCFKIRRNKVQILKQIQKLQQSKQRKSDLQKILKQKYQKKYSSYYRAQKEIQNLENKIHQHSICLGRQYQEIKDSQQLFHKNYMQKTTDYYEAIKDYYKLSQLSTNQRQIYEQYKKQFQNLYSFKNEKYIQPYIEECNKIIQKVKTNVNNQNIRVGIMQDLYKKIQSKQQEQRLYFQYASFNIPVFKNPGVTLLTIFIPLTILTSISLFIYLQDFKDFGARLANIATLMIAYTTYFQIIREKLHKFQDVVLMQILVYLQICSNILCIVQSYMKNQQLFDLKNIQNQITHHSYIRDFSHRLGPISQADQFDQSITVQKAGIFFKISAILLVLITLFVIIAYFYHRCVLRRRYTKGEQFINLCQNEEVTEFTKWYNAEADVYFHRHQSRLVPLKKSCR